MLTILWLLACSIEMKTAMALSLTTLSSSVRSHIYNNIFKTKDMVIDFRRNVNTPESTMIKRQTIKQVHSYKNLRTIINFTLHFEENCEAVCQMGHHWLFCLWNLSCLHIDRTKMTVFYCAFIESVLAFPLVSRIGNPPLKERNSLNQMKRGVTAVPRVAVLQTIAAASQIHL